MWGLGLAGLLLFLPMAGAVDYDLHDPAQFFAVESYIYGATPFEAVGSIIKSYDLDGDGLDELLASAVVSAGVSGRREAGMVSIIYGSTAGFAPEVDLADVMSATYPKVLRVEGDERESWFGCGFDVGDLDNDGIPDLAVGAPLSDRGDINGGAIYVFFGGGAITSPTTTVISTREAGLVITGGGDYDSVGLSVFCGDINADGKDDLLTMAPFGNRFDSNDSRRHVYVLYGGAHLRTAGRLDFSRGDWDLRWSDVPGLGLATTNGEGVTFGDVDGDGVGDLVLGVPRGDAAGNNSGFVAVYRGQARPHGTEMRSIVPEVDPADPTVPDILIFGERSSDHAGWSVEMGNVVGDASDDLIIGAPYADGFERDSGAVYCLPGPIASGTAILLSNPLPPGSVRIFGNNPLEETGISLQLTALLPAATDTTRADLAIGARHGLQAGGRNLAGIVYVLRTSKGLPAVVDLANATTADLRIFAPDKKDDLGVSLASGRIGSTSGVVSETLFMASWLGDGQGGLRENSGEILLLRYLPASVVKALGYRDLFLLSREWSPDGAPAESGGSDDPVGPPELFDFMKRWHK